MGFSRFFSRFGQTPYRRGILKAAAGAAPSDQSIGEVQVPMDPSRAGELSISQRASFTSSSVASPGLSTRGCTTPAALQEEAVSLAVEALHSYSQEVEIAEHLRSRFDAKYAPTWHCIVGRNFGM
ncbi:unnamed protein product [Protopolystoma xenopodis]|uniref:Dynein light chain n=1 Tax=Protopolystoma xenopodis TaxID=117903 RepID=A0A3S5ASW7_9PLAT|nr:unnamed protein product [Protopolystoma xenopodis]